VTDRIAIAIDGPAASGKSSTAKAVARALGFRHVDSGSLYRAATAARARRGGDPKSWSEQSVLDAAREVTLAPVEDGFIPLIDGDASDSEMRGDTVTGSVSLVARMPRVREWVNAQVRRAAESYDVVVDGRDIGTVVFPHAQLKIFLIADAEERARRRLKERLHREPTPDEIIAETAVIHRRDMMDAMQSGMAADAVKIDTTNLSQEGQVERIVQMARSARSS
jgi:cytidylate kinase